MEEKKIIDFFGWLRTIEISEGLKIDYSTSINYLKTSERLQRIIEAQYFVIDAMRENIHLTAKLERLSDSNKELIEHVVKLEERLNKQGKIKNELQEE